MDRNLKDSAPALLPAVALRKESVDRNISLIYQQAKVCLVALRKESVDRNAGGLLGRDSLFGRSPQGERG